MEKPDSPAIFLAYPFRSREDWIRRYALAILPRWGYAVTRVLISTTCKFLMRFAERSRTEEIGFARGKGVPVIVIVERGVDVDLGILSDIQRIDLDPRAPYHALIRLRLALKSILPNTRVLMKFGSSTSLGLR